MGIWLGMLLEYPWKCSILHYTASNWSFWLSLKSLFIPVPNPLLVLLGQDYSQMICFEMCLCWVSLPLIMLSDVKCHDGILLTCILLVVRKQNPKFGWCNFLDRMYTESTRPAYRDIMNAFGHARALEAASSLTKRHGRRNKKSPNC